MWHLFFPPSQRRIPGQKELAHTMARVYERVFAYCCVSNVCFITRLYFLSSMEPFSFFFWCGLEKPFQGKAGSIAFVFALLFGWSLWHSAQGSALFLPPGLGTLLGGSVGNEASIICNLPLSRSSLH